MINFIRLIILNLFATYFGANVFASPNYLTLHSRISKPDNAGYLEAVSVQFRLSITDPVGTCILFQEDFANVDMRDSKGLIAMKMGSGVKAYPGVAMTMKDLFTNFSSPVFNCQSGGTYTAGATDQRKLVMQFNDGSGWQTVPSLEINSVPFALESLSSQKLGAFPAADYVRLAQFTTCNPGEAVYFNGTSFTCVVGGIANGGNTGVMTIGTNDASSLNLETNNTTRMTIDSTGNVGIGGAIVPAATLHTQTSGAKTSTTISNYIENNSTSSTNAINKVGLDIQSTGVWSGTSANNVGLNVNVSGGTNNYAAIFQGGNVGIGTTGPTALLHLTGSDTRIRQESTNAGIFSSWGGYNITDFRSSLYYGPSPGSASGNTFYVSPEASSAGDYTFAVPNGESRTIRFRDVSGAWSAADIIVSKSAGSNANGTMSFKTTGHAVEQLFLDAVGNVGIGTATPGGKLEVSNGSGSYVRFDVGNPGMLFNKSTNVSGSWGLHQGWWDGQDLTFLFNGSNPVISMRPSGNVGIGTASPAVSLDIGSKTDGARMPNGTTAQRPTCDSNMQGAIRYNSQTAFMEFCDGTGWYAMPKLQPTSPPTTPAGSGYFVVTATTWDGNLGGRIGADSKCLTELATTYTNWSGYADANSRGLLIPAKVKAFICDITTCNNLTPLGTYIFSVANQPGAGGASFTVDGSGGGPNDSAVWSAANRFNGTANYWSGRAPGTNSVWSTSPWGGANSSTFCNGWSSAAATSGQAGDTGSNNVNRWQGTAPACGTLLPLICMVNP